MNNKCKQYECKQYRQGDVFVQAVEKIPQEVQQVEPTKRGYVLAEGEATGHAHTVDPRKTMMFLAGMTMYLKVLEEVQLRHEEHNEIILPVGDYEVYQQREYSPEEIRTVKD